MKKTKIALSKKLVLSKETVTSLDNDQQMAIAGGASATEICAVSVNNICVRTAICPVLQTADCITRRQTWCWVAGSSCM